MRGISKSSHPVTPFVLIPPPSEIWPPSLDENRSFADELKNEGYPVLLARAQKLQAFFSQPFFVAEPFTKRQGSHVSRAGALRGCREILDGHHDDIPVAAFYFTGSIEEILGGAAEI